MAVRAIPPKGWEIVERKKYYDRKKEQFEADRNNPKRFFREWFVRKIPSGEQVQEPEEQVKEEDLYLWRDVKDVGGEKKTIFETEAVLREKDVSIIFGMSVYLIVKCARDCFILLSSLALDLRHGRIWCVLKDIGGFVWGKVRDPFFAVAVIACALFGLISPFKGRPYLARVERKWHYVEDLRKENKRIHYQDTRYYSFKTTNLSHLRYCQSDKDGNTVYWKEKGVQYLCARDEEGVPVLFSRHYYFLIAYCFQPHGRSDDLRYKVESKPNESIKC